MKGSAVRGDAADCGLGTVDAAAVVEFGQRMYAADRLIASSGQTSTVASRA